MALPTSQFSGISSSKGRGCGTRKRSPAECFAIRLCPAIMAIRSVWSRYLRWWWKAASKDFAWATAFLTLAWSSSTRTRRRERPSSQVRCSFDGSASKACSLSAAACACSHSDRHASSHVSTCCRSDWVCRLRDCMFCCKLCNVSFKVWDSSTISSSFSGGSGRVACFAVGPYTFGTGCEIKAPTTTAFNCCVDVESAEEGDAACTASFDALVMEVPAPPQAASLAPLTLRKLNLCSSRFNRRLKPLSSASLSWANTSRRNFD
mmetsp:Transcript_85121/g.260093  ORF Transcript_85121/g.260093 Transcript_85121/m.260093 type:complete len:263 (-) Transcript_85121:408-1196(-)